MITDQVEHTANVHINVWEDDEWVEGRHVTNTTVVGFDNLISSAISPSSEQVGFADRMVVGTGDNDPTYRSEEMFEEVARFNIDQFETGEDYVVCYGFLSTNQGNTDDTLKECGILTTTGELLNHASFPEVQKHSGRIVNFAVRLGYGPVQE